MKSGSARIGIRDRLIRLVDETGRDERGRLMLQEPEVVYDRGQTAGGKTAGHPNGSIENYDWFTIGMGEKIRKRRMALGITQAELARRMHVSATTVSRIECGKVNLCGQEINRLCKELNCLLADIWPDESVIRGRALDRKIMIEAMRRLLEKLDQEMEESE